MTEGPKSVFQKPAEAYKPRGRLDPVGFDRHVSFHMQPPPADTCTVNWRDSVQPASGGRCVCRRAQSEDLGDASYADADVEPPPIPSLDAGSPLDAATSADAAPDAASSPDAATSMDSGALPDAASSTDAGADAAVADAGTDASAADASLPACAGARVRGLCWYFGSLNDSCLRLCSSRGGYDSCMVGVVGTTSQGGTVEACNEVLAALGLNGTATPARRTDNKGYGCHQWGADLWWINSAPDFRPDVAGTSARVACLW